MAAVARVLREKLGEDAIGGLQALVDDAGRRWKEDVLVLVAERFDRRLGEEIGALRLDMAKEFAAVRVDTAKEFAAGTCRDGRDADRSAQRTGHDTLQHSEMVVFVLGRTAGCDDWHHGAATANYRAAIGGGRDDRTLLIMSGMALAAMIGFACFPSGPRAR